MDGLHTAVAHGHADGGELLCSVFLYVIRFVPCRWC